MSLPKDPEKVAAYLEKLKFRQRNMSKETREKIFERDNYTDWYSGLRGSANLVAHHIIPLSKIIKQYEVKTIQDALNCKLLWDTNNGVTMFKKSHKAHHSMWG